jgi:hypothetical protein
MSGRHTSSHQQPNILVRYEMQILHDLHMNIRDMPVEIHPRLPRFRHDMADTKPPGYTP